MDLNINVTFHEAGDRQKLDEVLRLLRQIFQQGEKLMALSQDTKDLLAKLDAATNAIAAKLQKLIDAAANAGSVSEAEVRAALQPEIDKLQALGADESNPVPRV